MTLTRSPLRRVMLALSGSSRIAPRASAGTQPALPAASTGPETRDWKGMGSGSSPLSVKASVQSVRISRAGFPVKGPAIGLFADQEIRLIKGPLFVGEDYLLRREIVALSESRRTESYWARTRVFDAAGETLLAEMLLNHAILKHSYADYPQDRLSS